MSLAVSYIERVGQHEQLRAIQIAAQRSGEIDILQHEFVRPIRGHDGEVATHACAWAVDAWAG